MRIYIKNATLCYPEHKLHGKVINALISNNLIESINPADVLKFDREINAKGMHLFPSLVDIHCFSGEPGHEDKEDFDSLCEAAKAGGFSDVFLLPDTHPVNDSKSGVSYIHQASKKQSVNLHALGAITKELKGQDLSEIFDMHLAGAKAFSDAKNPVGDVNMMKRALDYVKSFNGIVYSFPMDERLSPGGMVNESPNNTSLGLKTTPKLAEELLLNRDIYLLEYTGSRLHVAVISSEGSVSLIQKAKKKGLDITCSVAMSHLLFNESKLDSFDTVYKTNPPLRSESDRKALIKAINAGVIDMIHSDHCPEIIENKDVEFDQAHYGMTMLETILAAYNTYLSKDISLESMVNAMSIAPRKRFGLTMPALDEGNPFDFTLFDPKQEWTYDASTIKSKSNNSPFFNTTLTGKVVDL